MLPGGRIGLGWLHTWAGLTIGWLLYAIFVTGTASFYRQEISQWMRPEIRPQLVDPAASAEAALRRLQTTGAGAERWRIELATDRIPSVETYMWRKDGAAPHFQHEILDPVTARKSPARATLGGDLLYYFHFDLQMPSIWGRLIVGFAAVTMLVTLVTGIVTHRRFFRDFFTFRPRSAPGRAWLDAHNAFGVLALPFHFVITYTGLITLMFLYMPWGIKAVYPGKPEAFYTAAHMTMAIPEPKGAAPLAPLGPMMEEAQRQWQGGSVGVIEIVRPGDASAAVKLTRNDAETLSFEHDRLLFEGATGKLISTMPPSAAEATRMVFYGLHIGRFADHLLRPFLFLCGLAGTAMIASGLVLWPLRRAARQGFGYKLVNRLNGGTILGLPIAIAAYFWANRLLPAASSSRLLMEAIIFFSAWITAYIIASLCPLRFMWRVLLSIAAMVYLLLPLINIVKTDRGLNESLAGGDSIFAGFDLMMFLIGVLCAIAAFKVSRPSLSASEEIALQTENAPA